MPVVKVKLSNGTTVTVELPAGYQQSTVADAKQLFAAPIGIPAPEQRVVFKGKVLKDSDVLGTVGVQDGDTMHVVKGKAPSSEASASAPAPTTTAASSAPPRLPTAEPSTGGSSASAASNPYAALFGGALGGGAAAPAVGGWPGLGVGGSPAGDPFSAGGMDDPMMQAMLSNPQMMQFAAQMLASNPQMMQDVARSHPMLQNLPPEQRDQMVRMMSDPQVIAQSFGMMAALNAQRHHQQPGGASAQAAHGGGTAPAPAPAGFGLGGPWGSGGLGGGAFAPPQVSREEARTRYATQLEQLKAMGFPNDEANLTALIQSQGSVDFAIERLLSA